MSYTCTVSKSLRLNCELFCASHLNVKLKNLSIFSIKFFRKRKFWVKSIVFWPRQGCRLCNPPGKNFREIISLKYQKKKCERFSPSFSSNFFQRDKFNHFLTSNKIFFSSLQINCINEDPKLFLSSPLWFLNCSEMIVKSFPLVPLLRFQQNFG